MSNDEEVLETAMEIICVFTDLLDKYGIKIPDNDRTTDPTESSIFGATHYEVEEKVKTIIRSLDKIDKDKDKAWFRIRIDKKDTKDNVLRKISILTGKIRQYVEW